MEPPENVEDVTEHVRARLEAAERSGDEARLKVLEQLHEELETRLEAEDPEGTGAPGA